MTRQAPALLTLLLLLALPLVFGCSEDDENDPPRVAITSPDDGHRFTDAATEVTLSAEDDNAVSILELRLDGQVVVTMDGDEDSAVLPLGRWADGLDHELQARAHDTDGATGDSGVMTISIDPSLQTIPQITGLSPDAEAPGELAATWLAYPDAQIYLYEFARTDGFVDLLASGSTDELGVNVVVDDASLVYLRVSAMTDGVQSDWSRTFRYDGTSGWRQRYELSGKQLGTALLTSSDGMLWLLSHAVRETRVDRAAVELLRVSPTGEAGGVRSLLDATHLPTAHALTADDRLLLTGVTDAAGGFVAAFDLDGAQLWYHTVAELDPTALLHNDGDLYWLAGADQRDGASGGVIGMLDAATGEIAGLMAFDLEAGARPLVLWPHADGGWVVAGQLADAGDQEFGGMFASHVDLSGDVLWRIRVGAGDRWLLRGHGSNGTDQFCLGGIAYRTEQRQRYGFVVNFDDQGRLRWQIGDYDWHLFSDLVALPDGRWTAAGARRRYVDSDNWLYDAALASFSGGGQMLWEMQHQSGAESQSYDLAPHPDGGWYVLGFMTPDRGEFDLDLLRVDDLGELE